MKTRTQLLITLTACAAAVMLLSMRVVAQTNGSPERFWAVAINMGTLGPAGAGRVEIAIDRWSSEAERTRLISALVDKGPEKLLDTLTDLPRAGYIRTPNSIGYDIHYARREPLPEGGERVTLATDRYITFWEARNRPRSIDYPFTVIEMHIDRDGKGEGKMSIATKITVDKDKNTIVLEDYATQPVRLSEITRETR